MPKMQELQHLQEHCLCSLLQKLIVAENDIFNAPLTMAGNDKVIQHFPIWKAMGMDKIPFECLKKFHGQT